MRVLIDMTDIVDASSLYKSIPIWLTRIVKQIPASEVRFVSFLVTPSMVDYFRNSYPGFSLIPFKSQGAVFPSPSFIKYLKSSLRLKKILNANSFDCLLLQGGVAKHLFFKHKEKVIVVEHDMKTLKDRGRGFKGMYMRYMEHRTTGLYFKFVDRIITISQYTKKDILSLFPNLAPNKVSVVYNSVFLTEEMEQPKSKLPDKYILYVNTLQEYKNVGTLIKAYNNIKEKVGMPLVLVGKNTDYWEKTIMPFVRDNYFEDRLIRLEGLDDGELRYLYEKASLFVTPSTHEGFGYTPIEAAMSKCPVVSTTCEALPETTRGLLYYYNPPMDENALGNIILEVLSNPPSSSRLESIAEEYKSVYSPDVQYNCILNLMREVCCHVKEELI